MAIRVLGPPKPGTIRYRIEHEVMHGPYRTTDELGAYIGCSGNAVRDTIDLLRRRLPTYDEWPPSASSALDTAVRQERKRRGYGPPSALRLPWPADDADDQAVA